MKLVLVEYYSDLPFPGEPDAALTAQLTRNGVARAYRGDDGIWYCADSVEPKRAATPRYAVVRMGEVES